MPRPLYIICSKSGAEDSLTGYVSLFEILERLIIRKRKDDEIARTLSFRIDAAWARSEDAESAGNFEFQNSLLLPPDSQDVVMQSGVIRFEKPRHHFVILVAGLQAPTPGTLRARSKLRLVGSGDEDWITQEYPIDVVDITDDESEAQSKGGR